MNIEAYEAAAEVQRDANRLAQVALAPYWERVVEIANAEDIGTALNEGILGVEDDGEVTLAIGGPGVWLLPSGVLAGAWAGPRIYATPSTREEQDAAETILDYIRELRAEGVSL